MISILNIISGQKILKYKSSEKTSIFILFAIFCYSFNVSLIIIDASAMHAENLNDMVDSVESGSLYNKVYWSFLFILSLLIIIKDKLKLIRSMQSIKPIYLLIFLLVSSILWSDYPLITLRRSALSVFVIFSIMVSCIYIKKPTIILFIIYRVIAISLTFNIIALVLGKGFSADGLFSGIHGHKNTAGLVASIALWASFSARYVLNQKNSLNLIIILGWVIVLLLTRSKTSITLCLLSPLIWYSINLISNKLKFSTFYSLVTVSCSLILCITSLLLFNGLSLAEGISVLGGDISLTGRDFIWTFVLEYIFENPILGVGYGAFWDVGQSSANLGSHGHGRIYLNFLHQAHNGYLDILVNLGIVGLISILVIIFQPLKIITSNAYKNNIFSQLSGILIVFIFLHNITESSLLRTTHLNWVMILILFFIFSILNKKRLLK